MAWAGTPKIQFDKTIYDFGKTSQVQRVAGTFIFTNTGDEVLKLEQPTTSCGCTVATLKTNILQPGERGELGFTLNVGPYRTTLQKYITVPSNDPTNPRVNLTVKAEYVPLYDVTPPMLYVDNLRPGAATNLNVTVKRTDGKKLALTKAEAMNPWVQAKIVPGEGTNEATAKIAVEVKPEGMPRRFYESIRVYSEEAKEPAITISLSGRVVGDVAWNPEMLYWAIGEANLVNGQIPEVMATRRMIVTTTAPDKAVEVRNPASTVKQLKLELVPRNPGKQYEVVARLTEMPQSTLSGTISFDTDLPSLPKVTVPVTISVLPRATAQPAQVMPARFPPGAAPKFPPPTIAPPKVPAAVVTPKQ